MVQMLSPPPRSLVKAMREPSGEKRGWNSHAMPDAMAVAFPPLTGMV